MAATTATTKSIRRPTVTLQLPRKVPALIVYAERIVKGMMMTANRSFPSPSRALAPVTSALDALRIAETALRKLTAIREKKSLSQTVVAARMGTSASVVSKLEAGGAAKVLTLQRYCAAIGEMFSVAV